jgi:hypothetical protein
MEELLTNKTYNAINRAIRALNIPEMEMEEEHTAVPENTAVQINRFVKVHSAVKPLLLVVSVLPLFPQAWRTALALFVQTLDGIANSALNPAFKAGKDL